MPFQVNVSQMREALATIVAGAKDIAIARAGEIERVVNVVGQYIQERYRALIAGERRLAQIPLAVRFGRASTRPAITGADGPLVLFIPSSSSLGAPAVSAERILEFLADCPMARGTRDTIIVTNSLDEEESRAVALKRDGSKWRQASETETKQAFQEGAQLLAKNSWTMLHESPEEWPIVQRMAQRGAVFAVQGEDFSQASNLYAGLAVQALLRKEGNSAETYQRLSFQWGPYARAIEGLMEALTLIRAGRIHPDSGHQLMDLLANQPYLWINDTHYLMNIGLLNRGLLPEQLPAFFNAIEQKTPSLIDVGYKPGQLIDLSQVGIRELIGYARTISLSHITTNMIATVSALQEPLLHLQLAMERRVSDPHERDGLTQAVIRDRIVNTRIGGYLNLGGFPLSRSVRGILTHPDHVTPFLRNHSSDQKTPPRVPRLEPVVIDAIVAHLERLEAHSSGGPRGGGTPGGGRRPVHHQEPGIRRSPRSDDISDARRSHRHHSHVPLLALETGGGMMASMKMPLALEALVL